MRLELTIPDLQSGALAAWRRVRIGTEGEIRTLESSLEDSHVSSYITSACDASQGGPRLGGGVRTLYDRLEHRTGFEPVSQRWQRRVLNQLDQRCVFGRGGQS